MIAVTFPAAALRPDEQPREEGLGVPGPPRPAPEPPGCTGLTKSGDPCKGRPGDDGRCAAHKQQD